MNQQEEKEVQHLLNHISLIKLVFDIDATETLIDFWVY